MRAFGIFTGAIGRWWPLADHAVFEGAGTVAFVDGELVERGGNGERAVWGTVTRWEPGDALALTWHPGRSAELASHLEVTFSAARVGTLVTLEHSGWEGYDDPEAARHDYDEGWPVVLDLFRDLVAVPLPEE
jgi:hypothetical protein